MFTLASLVAQLVKNLPAMQETQVQFLGWEDPLKIDHRTEAEFLLSSVRCWFENKDILNTFL